MKAIALAAALALIAPAASAEYSDDICLAAQSVAEAAHELREKHDSETVYLLASIALADAQPSPEQQAYFDNNLAALVALAFESSASAKMFGLAVWKSCDAGEDLPK